MKLVLLLEFCRICWKPVSNWLNVLCSKLLDRVITVEYAIKDDDDRRNGYSPDRIRDRSPKRGYDRVRSPSPYRRERESPDYGHGRARSPSPYRRERASPVYARGVPGRSPSRKERDPLSPRNERDSDYKRKRSPSPRNERESDYKHKRSPSPRNERDSDYKHKRSPSPRKVRESDHKHKRSASPPRERSNGDAGHGPIPGGGEIPDYGGGVSPASEREPGERLPSPDDYARDRSHAYSDAESPPPERYGRY